VQSGGLTGIGPSCDGCASLSGELWEVYEIRGLRRDVMAFQER
jgi:hypothetical protein